MERPVVERAEAVLERCGWAPRAPSSSPPAAVGAFALTPEYRDLLSWTDGGACRLGESPLSLLELWSSDVLDERQALVRVFMPGALSIGGDGGSREYVVDHRAGRAGAVYSVDRGDVGWGCDTLRVLGRTLAEAFETLRAIPPDAEHPGQVGRPG